MAVARSPSSAGQEARNSFDSVLVAARNGEQWAFRSLFEALSSQIAAFVRARHDRDVDDIVNEIFLGAFRNLDRFAGGEADYRAWVFRIARNKINDSHRRSYRTVPQANLDTESDTVHSAQAESDLTLPEQREQIELLLRGLSADQRDVILLRILADLSIEQVAEILEKPPGAIKSLQHRALEALRRQSSSLAVSP